MSTAATENEADAAPVTPATPKRTPLPPLPPTSATHAAAIPPLADPVVELRHAAAVLKATPDHDHAAALAALPSLVAFAATAVASSLPDRRTVLERFAAVRARRQILADLAAGKNPAPPALPAAEIAVELVKNSLAPDGLRRLLGALTLYVADDKAELAQIGATIQSADANTAIVGALHAAHLRQAELEKRIPVRQAALDGFNAAYTSAMAKIVSREADAIVSGIAEVDALASSPMVSPDPAIATTATEFAGVVAQLAKIVPPGGVKPGLVAQDLTDRKAELEAKLTGLHAANAVQAEETYRTLVDRLSAADPDALATVFTIVNRNPAAFPPGLSDRLIAPGLTAISGSDPVTWVKVLDSCGQHDGAIRRNGTGREFA